MVKKLTLFLFLCFSIQPLLFAQKTPLVFVEKVQVKEVHDSVEALGTLVANESVDLTVNTMETIRALHFDDGDRVKKGALLVEMTDEEEHALLEEARITVEEAKRQYERLKPLASSGAASESALDQSLREYETAKARLDGVKSRMHDRVIHAPFEGVLGLRNVSVGALVQPGNTVARLIDDSVMKLDFAVPATFLSSLKKALPVSAKSTAFGSQMFEGQVHSIDNTIDPITRSIMIRALIPNPDKVLKPGLLMSVDLKKNLRQAHVISEEALISNGDEYHVFKVVSAESQNKLTKIKVDIGSRWPGEVEILSGLSEGDEIVVHGAFKSREGMEVETRLMDEKPFENKNQS